MPAVPAGKHENPKATEDARAQDPPPQSMSMLGSQSSTGWDCDVAEGAPLGSSETPSPSPPVLRLVLRRLRGGGRLSGGGAQRIGINRTSRRDAASKTRPLRPNRAEGHPPHFRADGVFRGSCDRPLTSLAHYRSRSFSTRRDAGATRDFAVKQKAALTPARGALSFALFRTTRVARSHCPVAQWQSR